MGRQVGHGLGMKGLTVFWIGPCWVFRRSDRHYGGVEDDSYGETNEGVQGVSKDGCKESAAS
jgi:hypothetical protein